MVRSNSYYLEKEVLQASPIEQIILLYNKAISSLRMVENTLTKKETSPEDIKNRAEHLTKVIDILTYLASVLDEEKGKEIAKNLKDIYNILIEELIKVNFTKDHTIVKDAAHILENLKRAWMDIKTLTNGGTQKEHGF